MDRKKWEEGGGKELVVERKVNSKFEIETSSISGVTFGVRADFVQVSCNEETTSTARKNKLKLEKRGGE